MPALLVEVTFTPGIIKIYILLMHVCLSTVLLVHSTIHCMLSCFYYRIIRTCALLNHPPCTHNRQYVGELKAETSTTLLPRTGLEPGAINTFYIQGRIQSIVQKGQTYYG